MRTIPEVEEFRREANNALFTKQQAISVTLRLLEEAAKNPDNREEDKQTFLDAMTRINFHYLDATDSSTDAILDSIGVARFTAADIISAIEFVLFESENR